MSRKHCGMNDRVPPCTTCCNIFQTSKKYATRQWPTTHRTWDLSLITSRPQRCAARQWAWIHGHWNMFLITWKHKKCAMRQWPTTYRTWDLSLITLRFKRCAMMLCSWIQAWFLLLPMRYYFVCLRCYSLLFLTTLKLKRCVEKPLKKIHGYWSLSLIVSWRRRCVVLQCIWSHPWSLRIIPDHFKSQEMCDEAVARRPYTLKNVPDWFLENNR